VPEVELLSIPEAAQRLGVDPRTVREAIGRGDIPVTLVGQRLKISARTIDTIIASAVVEVTTAAPVGGFLAGLAELDRQTEEAGR
jgi:excisionase family DNA binding protein